MKPNIINALAANWQDRFYQELSHFSYPAQRLGLIPLAVADLTSKVAAVPFSVIERIAFAVFNLVGAPLGYSYTSRAKQPNGECANYACTLKDAIWCTEEALKSILSFPVDVALAPVKMLYQIVKGEDFSFSYWDRRSLLCRRVHCFL